MPIARQDIANKMKKGCEVAEKAAAKQQADAKQVTDAAHEKYQKSAAAARMRQLAHQRAQWRNETGKHYGKTRQRETSLRVHIPGQGIVVGQKNQKVGGTGDCPNMRQFLGIPFAAPPVGDLRWQPPEAACPCRHIHPS